MWASISTNKPGGVGIEAIVVLSCFYLNIIVASSVGWNINISLLYLFELDPNTFCIMTVR